MWCSLTTACHWCVTAPAPVPCHPVALSPVPCPLSPLTCPCLARVIVRPFASFSLPPQKSLEQRQSEAFQELYIRGAEVYWRGFSDYAGRKQAQVLGLDSDFGNLRRKDCSQMPGDCLEQGIKLDDSLPVVWRIAGKTHNVSVG